MPNPDGRPKGPPKRRVLVTLSEGAFKWVCERASSRSMSPPAYIAAGLEKRVEEHSKSASKAKHPTASLPLERDAAPMPKKRDQK